MKETFLRSLTDVELLKWVNRDNPEVRELAERLERRLGIADPPADKPQTTKVLPMA